MGLCGLTAAAAVPLANDGAVLLETPVCAERAALLALEPDAALGRGEPADVATVSLTARKMHRVDGGRPALPASISWQTEA